MNWDRVNREKRLWKVQPVLGSTENKCTVCGASARKGENKCFRHGGAGSPDIKPQPPQEKVYQRALNHIAEVMDRLTHSPDLSTRIAAVQWFLDEIDPLPASRPMIERNLLAVAETPDVDQRARRLQDATAGILSMLNIAALRAGAQRPRRKRTRR